MCGESYHAVQAATDLRCVNWLCGLMRQRHIDFQEHRGRGTKIRTGLAVTAISEQRATAVSGMRRHVFCRMLHLRRSGLSRFWLRGNCSETALQKMPAEPSRTEEQDGEQGSVFEDAFWRLLPPRGAAGGCRTHPCRAGYAVRRIHAPLLAAGMLLR